MSNADITGFECSVAKVFSDEFAFEVPEYQRPYSWKEKNVEDLFSDILESMRVNSSSDWNDCAPYFLGCVVLVKDAKKPEAQILDGQQRLISLTILLSMLRHFLPKKMAEDVSECLFERENTLKGVPARYRITLRTRDEIFFREKIQKNNGSSELDSINLEPLSDSQKNITLNARKLAELIGELTEGETQQFAKYLTQKCFLVVVCTPSFESGYRIFSILNDRGMPLSATDILKAKIIGAIPEPEVAEYTTKWEDLEDDFGVELFNQLFSQIRMIFRKTKSREIKDEFSKLILPQFKPTEFIDSVLIPYAYTFDIAKRAAYVGPRKKLEINRLLRWLNRIESSDWLPIAMLCIRKWENEPEALLDALTRLEKLAAFLFVTRKNENQRIERYRAILLAMENDQDVLVAESPLNLTASDSLAFLEALDGPLYEENVKVCQYVLLRLDEQVASAAATYDHPRITIEHVLPQKPASASQWMELFTPKEALSFTHRIGNLVLLTRSKNSRCSNYEFKKKKEEYFLKGATTTFALTAQVITEPEWTPKVLKERQKHLLDTLSKVWQLPVHDTTARAGERTRV